MSFSKSFSIADKLEMADGTEVPIEIDGNWNKHSDRGMVWRSPCFEASIGGFIKPEPTVSVTQGAHPTLWLLIGFVAAHRLSPDDVKSNCRPPFFHV